MEHDIERFCGPWSLSAGAVKLLLHPDDNAPPWLMDDIRRRALAYWREIEATVAEMELKLPDLPCLSYWREAVEFWGNVVNSQREAVELGNAIDSGG